MEEGNVPKRGSTWLEISCFLFLSYILSSTQRMIKVQLQTSYDKENGFSSMNNSFRNSEGFLKEY